MSDPGMDIKMNNPSFRGLRALAAGGELSAEGIADLEERCAYVEARHDCADFRALVLIKTILAWNEHLPTDLAERITGTLLNHKYWMDEPGDDGMCLWSENHQLIAAVTEYLVGQRWPEASFTNADLTGQERRERAQERLTQWLDNRFRFGFSEWLSPEYYEEDIAALAVFIDHADDAELVERASMIMDLVLLDIALHAFPATTGTRFLPATGRLYTEAKFHPDHTSVVSIVAELAGEDAWDERRLSALFHARSTYRVPPVVSAILAHRDETTVRATFGLDAEEVIDQVGDGVSKAGLFFWGMEAITTVPSIELSSQMLHLYSLTENAFLKGLTPFAELRGRGVLHHMMRVLNPATQGVALQRANVTTTRKNTWCLSATQMYHPRSFGDQQHVWQAQLPGDVSVFSTHPSEAFFDETARNFSPSWWVGNGRIPFVGADANAVLVLHDLTGRSGYLEQPRVLASHLHWPQDRFDDEARGLRWRAGRVGDSYIGVLGLDDLLPGNGDELRQEGTYTAWAVFCSDAAECGDFDTFVSGLTRSAMRLVARGKRGRFLGRAAVRTLELQTDPLWAPARERWQWEIGPEGFLIDEQPIDVDHPRLDSAFGQVERDPGVIRVEHDGHGIALDWTSGTREIR